MKKAKPLLASIFLSLVLFASTAQAESWTVGANTRFSLNGQDIVNCEGNSAYIDGQFVGNNYFYFYDGTNDATGVPTYLSVSRRGKDKWVYVKGYAYFYDPDLRYANFELMILQSARGNNFSRVIFNFTDYYDGHPLQFAGANQLLRLSGGTVSITP